VQAVTTRFDSVDAYIESFPPAVQVILEEVRRTIHHAVPDAEEKISYQIPTVTLGGRYLVYFAGWKKHISIYPVHPLEETLETEVSPHRSGKDTLKFSLNEPIPYELIGRVVAAMRERRLAAEQ
jgi:uncharacterized protein YdhG (YjbR/CyaY superfamily)